MPSLAACRMDKEDLVLNNTQELICHKPKQTNNTWNYLTECKQMNFNSFKKSYLQSIRFQIIYMYKQVPVV